MVRVQGERFVVHSLSFAGGVVSSSELLCPPNVARSAETELASEVAMIRAASPIRLLRMQVMMNMQMLVASRAFD